MTGKNQRLSTQPYKGARDFYPDDMRVQNYFYETWKKVCLQYGFEQYDFPILEPLEIFSAKTGEEIVNEQLFWLEDKGGRKLAVRPELTPGTVRMIAQRYKEIPQPIKWFMIGNNWRFEKPQMGRGREFYQLEANIFGIEGVEADLEIFSLIADLMKAFGADENMYEIRVSDRRIISGLLENQMDLDQNLQVKVRRMMDKRSKMTQDDFFASLKDFGLNENQITIIENFLYATYDSLDIDKNNPGIQTINKLFELLNQNNLDKFVRFDPTIIRGFDYSDGLVYEVFDKNPKNRRSLFGGERFDRLINIFGDYTLPSTGFALGDYTLLEFLKGWNLLPQFPSRIDYFVALWPSDNPEFLNKSLEVALVLRNSGKNVFTWMEQTKLDKQLKYADKKNAWCVLIIGEEELKNNTLTVKNMENKTQKTISFENMLSELE